MNEQTNKEINIEQIMAEIREKIRTEGKYDDIPSFDDIPIHTASGGMDMEEYMNREQLNESLAYLKANHHVAYYWEFSGNKVKVLIKRIVRKLAKCLLLPIVDQQNGININATSCINNIRCGLRDVDNEQKRLAEEVKRLRKTIEAQHEQIEKLEKILKMNAKSE